MISGATRLKEFRVLARDAARVRMQSRSAFDQTAPPM